MEALYGFFVAYDFWKAGRDGCEQRLRLNFLELGPLMWSTTTESDRTSVRHYKKAEEWLSDSIVMAMASQRVNDRLFHRSHSSRSKNGMSRHSAMKLGKRDQPGLSLTHDSVKS